MNIKELCEREGITLSSVEDYNDKAPQWALDNGHSHYRVTLKHQGRRMSFWYYMGRGHKNAPTVDMVVESLASDSYIAGLDFDDFIFELGIQIRSTREFMEQRKSHKLTQSLNRRFVRLLGDSLTVEQIEEAVNA